MVTSLVKWRGVPSTVPRSVGSLSVGGSNFDVNQVGKRHAHVLSPISPLYYKFN